MDIRPIKSEADYRAALQEIESLMRAEAGTPAKPVRPSASVVDFDKDGVYPPLLGRKS